MAENESGFRLVSDFNELPAEVQKQIAKEMAPTSIGYVSLMKRDAKSFRVIMKGDKMIAFLKFKKVPKLARTSKYGFRVVDYNESDRYAIFSGRKDMRVIQGQLQISSPATRDFKKQFGVLPSEYIFEHLIRDEGVRAIGTEAATFAGISQFKRLLKQGVIEVPERTAKVLNTPVIGRLVKPFWIMGPKKFNISQKAVDQANSRIHRLR